MRKEFGLGCVLCACLALVVLLFWSDASAQMDTQACLGCHEAVFQRLQTNQTGMVFLKHPRAPSESLVCEACHGSLTAHADSDGQKFDGLTMFKKNSGLPASKRNEPCLSCHNEKRSRMFWQGSAHEMRDVACSDCHNPHKYGPETTGRFLLRENSIMDTCNTCHKQQVAAQMRFSHHPLREGQMTCTSCHQPHGTYTEKLLKGNTLNEACYNCHAKYRGPVISEHPPVRDNCANCHQPHGTNYPRLLKLPQVRLCRECHQDFHGLTYGANGQRKLPHVLGRACTDCHVNIHGSNSPAAPGEKFLR